MDMGSSPTSVSETKAGQTMVGRQFKAHRSFETASSLPGTFAQSTAAQDPANGWRSEYSFSAGTDAILSSIAAGDYDTRFANFIKSVPLGHKLDWSFCHEANAKLDTSTLANQTAAFQQAAQVMDNLRAQGVSQVVSGDVSLTLCLTMDNFVGFGDPAPAKAASEQNKYNPIIAVVDLFTIDFYGGSMGPNRGWDSRFPAFQYWWETGRGGEPPGKEVGTGRIGLWETSGNDTKATGDGEALKIEWIQKSTQGMYNIGAEVFTVFNSGVNGSQPIFSKQIYADTYAIAMDAYGGPSEPPPPPPPPPPVGAYNPQGGRAYFEQWA